MIITCLNCQTKYNVDEEKFAGKKVKCPKCGTIFQVPFKEEETVVGKNDKILKDTTKVVHTQEILKEVESLTLKGKRFSLAVLSGPLSGQVVKITKTPFVIGRANGDLIIPDTEVSRTHCQIEIDEEKIVLKDLGSTNGTYFQENKINEVNLDDKSEFRIGKTSLMFIITSEE
jgi:predicted Zn finger-like uncharacterized protein